MIFRVRSCKMRKKFANIFFWRLWKNPAFILINIFSPTFEPNLLTLAWKMSPGMPKEAGSWNSPLWAYLIRQNLHNRTHPRSLGYECPCHISKWSVKIYRRESANGDFPCAKLENAKKKKISPNEKTRNLYWLTCLALPLYQLWWLKLEKWVQECQRRPAY